MNIERIGAIFKGLTTVRVKNTDKLEKRKYAVYKCICGNKFIMLIGKEKHRESCGCIAKQSNIKRLTSHGMSHTKTNCVWRHMLNRCSNLNHPLYGGRGITICESWLIFKNFYNDMGERPEGFSIDRINNNLGYCKSNCRWTTPKVQARNRRSNTILTIDGISRITKEWSEQPGSVSYQTIISRLISGWSPKRAVFEKVNYSSSRLDKTTTRKLKGGKGYIGIIWIDGKLSSRTIICENREEAKLLAKQELLSITNDIDRVIEL
jgi:hypothetical protein